MCACMHTLPAINIVFALYCVHLSTAEIKVSVQHQCTESFRSFMIMGPLCVCDLFELFLFYFIICSVHMEHK